MNDKRVKNILILSMAFIFLLSGPLGYAQQEGSAAEKAAPSSLFDLFYRHPDTLPVLKIDTDWGQLVRTKQEEAYQPGVLNYTNGDGAAISMDIQLRARGNTRKKVCLFPPVKIKPSKQQLKALGFNPEYKLKLVLPCQGGTSNEECLLKEALAYKLYELACPIHFRTRLIELQIWQEGREKHVFYAFLIEEEDEMAARLSGRLLSAGKIRPNGLERSFYLKICFFQYLIANTDWSVASRHNLRFLQLPGYSRVVPVPYDFDYAGMVSTSYAIPGSTVPIEDVSQRYFLCEDITEAEALEYSAFFLARKEQVLQECRSMGLLRDRAVASVEEYLTDFFNILEDKELMINAIVKQGGVD